MFDPSRSCFSASLDGTIAVFILEITLPHCWGKTPLSSLPDAPWLQWSSTARGENRTVSSSMWVPGSVCCHHFRMLLKYPFFRRSQLTEQIHIRVHTNLCIYRSLSGFQSVAIYSCSKPNMSACWCLQPSSVIRWIVLASSTCLPVNFTIPWIRCSFSVYLYSGIRIVNPHPVGKKLQLEHSVYEQILLPLVL